MSHTQGKLKAQDSRIYFAGLAGGFDIRDCPAPEANARRLVACWNACEEFSTEFLEQTNLAHKLIGLSVCAYALESERNELLEALKATQAALKAAWDNGTLPASVISAQIAQKNDAAIQKAEEQA